MSGIASSIARPTAIPIASPIAGGGGSGGISDPRITVQPTDQATALGEDAVFGVTAEGTEPITYQWWEFK